MTFADGIFFEANSEDTVCTNSPASVFDGSESAAMKNLESVVSVKIPEPGVVSRTAGTEAISAPSAALTLIPQPRKGRAETTVSADKSSAVSRLVSFLFMFYCLPFLSDPEVTRVATCGYVLCASTG